MNDYISIKGLRVFAYHGVLEFEKEKGQEFIIDLDLYLDLSKAEKSDNLNDTVNYAKVAERVAEIMNEKSCDLIEKAAGNVATALLREFHMIKEITVKLHKPNAPVEVPFEDISVNITRGWHTAVLSVGSNMGDKEGYITNALCKLKRNPDIKDLIESSLITTEPYGGVEQDEFLNGAVILKTMLNPFELLDLIHVIEKEADRERVIHWGPRTLDLDIVFYDDLVIDTPDLKIPHVDMENRFFVLEPLMEICPYYVNPILKTNVKELLEKLREREMILI